MDSLKEDVHNSPEHDHEEDVHNSPDHKADNHELVTDEQNVKAPVIITHKPMIQIYDQGAGYSQIFTPFGVRFAMQDANNIDQVKEDVNNSQDHDQEVLPEDQNVIGQVRLNHTMFHICLQRTKLFSSRELHLTLL